jgi:hypothetical protein
MVTPLLSLVNSLLIFSHIIIKNSTLNSRGLHYIKLMSGQAVTAVIVSSCQALKIQEQYTCFPGVTTHYGCIFHSPVAGFILLVFEVS